MITLTESPYYKDFPIHIDIPDYEFDHPRWRSFIPLDNDYDICCKLENLIANELNCKKLYKGVIYRTIEDYNYAIYLAHYYRYLLRINNQRLYNKYVDKLIANHFNNFLFAEEHKHTLPAPKSKRKATKKKRDYFIRSVTTDLFTGESIYVYENEKTGEVIESTDGNLLGELNAKKKRIKRSKIDNIKQIPITFNFNKHTND